MRMVAYCAGQFTCESNSIEHMINIFIFSFYFYPLHTLQRTEQYKLIYQLENYTGYGRRPWTGVPPTLAYAIN